MGDEARERLRRRLQRYRQHHETSCCRYDNHINIVSEQQQEHTRLLHKRWLESQYGSSRKKRLKLAVVDEGTSESSNTSVNVRTSKSLVRAVVPLYVVVIYRTCRYHWHKTAVQRLSLPLGLKMQWSWNKWVHIPQQLALELLQAWYIAIFSNYVKEWKFLRPFPEATVPRSKKSWDRLQMFQRTFDPRNFPM